MKKTVFVKTVAKALFPMGEYAGNPCIYVSQGKEGTDKSMDLDALYSLVLSFSKVSYLWIDAEISVQNPDFFEFVVTIAKMGRHKVILRTPMSSDVTSLKGLRNVALILVGTPPNTEDVRMNAKNWAYLTETDSIVYRIGNEADYEATFSFLKDRTISRPSVIFHLSKEMPEKDYENIIRHYLTNHVRFGYRSKVMDTKQAGIMNVNDAFEKQAPTPAPKEETAQSTPDVSKVASGAKEEAKKADKASNNVGVKEEK